MPTKSGKTSEARRQLEKFQRELQNFIVEAIKLQDEVFGSMTELPVLKKLTKLLKRDVVKPLESIDADLVKIIEKHT